MSKRDCILAALLLVGSTHAWAATEGSADQGANTVSNQAGGQTEESRESYQELVAGADRGDPQALFRLGEIYENGAGVPQHFVRAHLYYNLAGANGSEEARAARDALAQRMSPAMIAEAQSLAHEWSPSDDSRSMPQQTVEAASSDEFSISWGESSGALTAILGDEVGRLRRILNTGGDPNQRTPDGDTLLLQAVRNSDVSVVGVLLDAGADPNLRGQGNWTPLKAAIYAGRSQVAEMLLAKGANPKDLAPDGLTALALAQRLGHAELVSVLAR